MRERKTVGRAGFREDGWEEKIEQGSVEQLGGTARGQVGNGEDGACCVVVGECVRHSSSGGGSGGGGMCGQRKNERKNNASLIRSRAQPKNKKKEKGTARERGRTVTFFVVKEDKKERHQAMNDLLEQK